MMKLLRLKAAFSLSIVLIFIQASANAFPGLGGGDPVFSTPGTPTSASVPSSSSTGNYTLQWSTVSGTTHYLWREKVSSSWSVWNNATGTSVTLSNRVSGVYSYEVKACHALATPDCSSAITSNSITVNRTQIPGTPPSITISDGSMNRTDKFGDGFI